MPFNLKLFYDFVKVSTCVLIPYFCTNKKIALQNFDRSPWLKYIGLGSQLLVMLGLAVYGGIQLDKKLNISPLFIISLPLLVLIVTFYKLIQETNKKKNDGPKK